MPILKLKWKQRAWHDEAFDQLLTEARMRSAEKLLRLTDKPVGEIAAELGYVAPSSFLRQFTRHHERSPSTWRRGI